MDWVNAIIALVVPFLSVFAANEWNARKDRRDRAMDIFVKLNRDIQAYRDALIENCEAAQTKSRLPYHTKMFGAAHVESPAAMEVFTALSAAASQVRSMTTDLENDRMILGMIFEKESAEIGNLITQLRVNAQSVLRNASSHDNRKLIAETIDPLIEQIGQAMKPLWTGLTKSVDL